MSESRSSALSGQSSITVSGSDPLRFVESLVATLASLTSDPDRPEDGANATSIVTFQAEANAISELVQGIADEVLATVADSPTNVAEIELANLLRADEGWRAWGYVRFGEVPRRGAPPRIAVEPSDTEADHPITVRLRVMPAAPASTGATGTSSSAGDGTGR